MATFPASLVRSAPGVTFHVGNFTEPRRASRTFWLTAQCEMDRDDKISSSALFRDDGQSVAKISGIAACFGPAWIPEQWPDGRDDGPVLGRSKSLAENCDEPDANVDRTTASPIRTASPL